MIQANRMFWKNKIVFVLLLFMSIFWYVVFSDAVNTHYTEFYFVSGSNHYKNLSVNLTWWETGHASFYLENKSNSTIDINMSFVDSEIITYGSTWVRVCKSENEKDEFGNYVDMFTSSFSLLAGSWITESLDLLFPAWYSWVYYGCVLYYPNVVDSGDNSLNTLARKAIFLDVDVIPTDAVFEVKVYPWARWNTTNPNLNWFENRWRLLFYANWDRTTVLYSWYIDDLNNEGTWSHIEDLVSWTYDVVYKWRHQLSSFISWIYITWWEEMLLDFTTWASLYWVESSSLVYNNWSWYQIAWDMFASNDQYDYQINSTDLSVLYWSNCPYGTQVWSPNNSKHKCDLNNDWWVDSSDASVIIWHDWYDDVAYGAWWEWFDGFGAVNY